MQEISAPLPVLLKMSGEASILILIVLAAQWLLGRRLKPRWRYALWLLVLLRLALPWTIPSPASLFNVLKMPAAAHQAQLEISPVQTVDVSNLNAEAAAASLPSSGVHWLAWLWATGAFLLASCAVISQYRFHRRVGRLRPLIDEPTLSLLEDCKALMGVSTPVTLVEMEAVKSPTLFGFVRPRLLLPTGLVSSFTRDELRHVFLHELAHIKRHDILTGWMAFGLQVVHWFNPLVWLALHRLRVDRELACDELALSCARTGENESYGLTIVKLLEGYGQSAWGPSLAGILEDKHQMKERICMIAKFHKTDRGLALAVVLLAGLALVTLTDAQSQTKLQPGQFSDPRLERKVEYSTKQASVQDIVRSLAEQVGLKYNWQKSFDQTDPLCRQWVRNVTIDGKTCQQALEQILKPVGLRYQVEDGVLVLSRQDEGMQHAPQQKTAVGSAEPDASQGVWAVKFEPVGDFSPKTPGEFLARIPIYSGQHGEIGYFRTKQQGDKLVGSFLASNGEQLKAALNALPDIKVTSVEKLTQEQLIEYEKSPQESLIDLNPDASKGVWAVRFEPVGDFAPRTPGEFLGRIHIYSGQAGEIGYFRTTKQGDKLIGSFLAYDGDQLKAALDKVPGIKVISVEKLTQETLAEYENLPQESLELRGDTYISQQTRLAKGGVRWAEFHLWDAYANGANGVTPNPAKADKWLRAFVKDVYVVRFEAAGDFHPRTAWEYLDDIRKHTSEWRSDDDWIGVAGFLRTKKEGDKLVAAQLSNEPEKLKALIEANPDLKFDSVEAMTPESFVEYEKSPQESLIDFNNLDASKGVWVVRFEPTGDFSPKTPSDFLARIHVYSGQDGEIGYFRTTKQGDKLAASFLAYDPDQLKAALAAIPGIKVTSVEKLTQEQLTDYEKSPQDSL